MGRTDHNGQLTKVANADGTRNIRLRDFARRMGRLEQRRWADGHPPNRLNWERLLGLYGKMTRFAALRPKEVHFLEKLSQGIYQRGWRAFRPKHCYQNCLRLLLEDHYENLIYWEGYADNGSQPFQHAWLTLNGKVVDPTLDALDRQGPPSPYRRYFGIKVSGRQIVRFLLQGSAVPFVTQYWVWEPYMKSSKNSGPVLRMFRTEATGRQCLGGAHRR